MSNDLHICILIPAFNNGGTVGAVVERALATGLPVIVVNDGSTDGTAEILSRLPVTVVSYGKNRGKGHALKTGFRKATGLGYDYAVTVDADGQHFPEDIPTLLDHAEKDRLVVGSRNLNAEGMPSGNTFANRFSKYFAVFSVFNFTSIFVPFIFELQRYKKSRSFHQKRERFIVKDSKGVTFLLSSFL